MKARKLIKGATYGPGQLKIIGQAFDEAWAQIQPKITHASGIETARLKLANAVLAVAATGGPIELEHLKAESLRVMHAQPPELGNSP